MTIVVVQAGLQTDDTTRQRTERSDCLAQLVWLRTILDIVDDDEFASGICQANVQCARLGARHPIGDVENVYMGWQRAIIKRGACLVIFAFYQQEYLQTIFWVVNLQQLVDENWHECALMEQWHKHGIDGKLGICERIHICCDVTIGVFTAQQEHHLVSASNEICECNGCYQSNEKDAMEDEQERQEGC